MYKFKVYHPKFGYFENPRVHFENGIWVVDFETSTCNGCFSKESGGRLLAFSGIKDKSGKEIFEGDILECPWDFDKKVVSVGKVIFCDGAFRLYRKSQKEEIEFCPYDLYDFNDTPTRACFWHKAKIIGNIFNKNNT